MRRKILLALVCSIAMVVSVAPVFGAMVSGTVTDTKGQAVVRAQVTFTDEADPSRMFSSLTDADGRYVVGLTEVAVEEEVEGQTVPSDFALLQNYPNPFNPSTKISYSIPKSCFVTLTVYDILGKKIQTLVSEFQNANIYSVNFDASKLSSGIYFYKLQAGDGFVETKKMTLKMD